MNKKLYPYYGSYIFRLLSIPVLFVLLVGVAIIWYHIGANNVPLEVYSPRALFVIIPIMIVYTGISVVLLRWKIRCPHCGKRNLHVDYDPPTVIAVSPKWETKNTIAICENCGYQQQTDLQIKSNIFIKALPVKIKTYWWVWRSFCRHEVQGYISGRSPCRCSRATQNRLRSAKIRCKFESTKRLPRKAF